MITPRAAGWGCAALLLAACGSHQLSAGDHDTTTNTESGTEPDLPDPDLPDPDPDLPDPDLPDPDLPDPDLPDPDPPSCDAAPPQSVSTLASTEGPINSSSGKMFYEPNTGWLLLFGGLREDASYDDAVLAIEPDTLTTFVLDWAAGPTFETTRVSAAEDPLQPRWWFVGGVPGQGFETEVLEVRLNGDVLAAEQLPALPSEVVDHGVGYDPESGRLLYVLGWDGHPPDFGYREETWVLHPDSAAPQWELLPGAGGPPGQRDSDLVYVPTEGLFLLAYVEPSASELSGIWQLRSDAEVWEPRALDLPPRHSDRARLFWDQPSCRLILWSDGYSIGVDVLAPVIWVLDPFTDPMTVVEIERPPAAPTLGHNAGYDPVHRIVVEQGGTDYSLFPESDWFYVKTIDSFALE